MTIKMKDAPPGRWDPSDTSDMSDPSDKMRVRRRLVDPLSAMA